MISIFSDKQAVVSFVQTIATIGLLISTLELMYNWRQMKPDGLFSWKILRSRYLTIQHNSISAVLNALLDFPAILILLGLRLIAMLVLIFLPLTHWGEAGILSLIVATILLVNYRNLFGQDGSDNMFTIIFVTLWINSLASEYPLVTELCLWFIALQACLSYFTSGIAKLPGEKWRQGVAVFEIFNTKTYGLKSFAYFLKRHSNASRFLSWSVVLIESSFPLVLIVGFPLCLIFITWGVVFHLINAIVMGLNSFLWAFTATYPAILFCTLSVQFHLLA